jgi:hypothetical protein
MARLVRDRDGEGYFGSRVEAWDVETGKVVGHEPMVGKRLLVGTMTAGMFTSRDWWMTTEIKEILSKDDEQVKFTTVTGSTYTFYWRNS